MARVYRFSISYCILLIVLSAEKSHQNLEAAVDLVTRVSNGLFPKLSQDLYLKTDNVIVNPFGVSSNIAMLVESSSGKTRQEALSALNITLPDMDDVRQGFRAYCELFMEHSSQSDSAGTFNLVSIKSSANIQPALKSILAKYYCANVTELKHGDTELNLLSVRSDSGVISHWKDFEKIVVYTFLSHKSVAPFYKEDGSVVYVPMVPQVGLFKTLRLEDYNSNILLVPLQTPLVELVLIVPDNGEDMKKLILNLSNLNMSSLVHKLQPAEQELFIPQFTTVSKEFNLTPYLRKLGIRLAFDSNKADFSRAGGKNTRMYLKDVKQDSYISTSFNSLKSVSAATSFLDLKARTKRQANKTYVDRPFLFFLLHKDTQLIVLAGKVGKPSQVPSKMNT